MVCVFIKVGFFFFFFLATPLHGPPPNTESCNTGVSNGKDASMGKMKNRIWFQHGGSCVIYKQDAGATKAFRNIPGVLFKCVIQEETLTLDLVINNKTFFFSFFEGIIVDWTNGTSWGMLPSGTLHKPASPEFKWVLKEQSHCYASVNLITVMSFHFMVRVFEILWYLKKFWVWAISCLFPCFHKFLYDLNSKCLIYSCLPMQKMTQTRTGSRRVWGSREHIVHPSKHRLALEIHSSFSTMMIFYFRSVFLKFCDI